MHQGTHTATNATTSSTRLSWILSGKGKEVIASLTLPMIPGIMMLLLLDFIDSQLIASHGIETLAALGFTLPVTQFIFALSIGVSIATVNHISYARSHNALGQQILHPLIFCFLVGTLVALLGWWLTPRFFSLFGIDGFALNNEGINKQALLGLYGDCQQLPSLIKQYLNLRLLSLPFTLLPMVSIGILRALGQTRQAAWLLCSWALFTVILDSLLVPHYGLTGLAWGHVISDVFFSSLSIYLLKVQHILRLTLGTSPPRQVWLSFTQSLRSLLSVSATATLNQALLPIALAIVTYWVAQSGPNAVASFAIASRIESLLLLLPMVLTTSLPVFTAQNHAAGQHQRIHQNLERCLWLVFTAQLLLALCLYITAPLLAELLSPNQAVQQWLVQFLQWLPISYTSLAITMLANTNINALGRPGIALLLSFFRFACCYLPCTYIGYSAAGLSGAFIGMAAGHSLTSLMSYKVLFALLKPKSLTNPLKMQYAVN